ncbi:glycosyltransferase family 2 protein [Nibrella saemangeumensis]|uniref:Glycosyltransferase family 2 protein n=1 Tax=Nibrella saemangeumensis TaxID=1084526 RepID=A0ABP8NDH1_9BACT
MKVSLITVVYNGAATIRSTIESILNQSYPDIEYIVIDGQSTDGTVDIIRSYEHRLARFVSEPDKGLYDAMNKGIRMATGDIIGLLNADDFYPHNDIIAHVAERFRQTGSDAVYGDMLYVNRDNIQQVKRYWNSGPYRDGAFLWGWMPGHMAFFARKRIYDQYGLFNLQLRSAADYELMLRFIHKHRISVSYLHEVLVVMREGGMSNSSLKNRLKANREDQLAWELNGLKPYIFTLWLKPLRKIGQFISKGPSGS